MEGPRHLTSILGVLLSEGVEFVLVGALAAVAQGAPLTTHDVDIVHARTPANLDRLMAALAKVNARYRGRAPEPLDCLGAIEEERDFDALVPLSVVVDFDGYPLRVLGLETIVELKRKSRSPKDRLALPVLEATLKRGRD